MEKRIFHTTFGSLTPVGETRQILALDPVAPRVFLLFPLLPPARSLRLEAFPEITEETTNRGDKRSLRCPAWLLLVDSFYHFLLNSVLGPPSGPISNKPVYNEISGHYPHYGKENESFTGLCKRAENEAALARLYSTDAELFPKKKTVWHSLASEGNSHAQMIRRVAEHSSGAFATSELDLDVTLIQIYLDYIAE